MKELLERGHDVVAFEAQAQIGGVYAHAWSSLELTASSVNISYGDSFDPQIFPNRVWRVREYLDHLEDFCARHDLERHVHFGARVTALRRCPQRGTWSLSAEACLRAQAERRGRGALPEGGGEFEFDHVAICAGVHHTPSTPDWPGAERFRGRIVHSSEFASGSDFAGQRVVVVGLGESGSDIALQVAREAEAVALSARRGPGYVIPRYYNGQPSDLDTNRCYHSIPRWLLEHPAMRFKSRIESLWDRSEEDDRVLRQTAEINARRGHAPFRRFGTKNAGFVEAMVHHGATYQPGIARLEPDHVVFTDGSTFACDTIICCTGFQFDFPFLHEAHPELAAVARTPRRLFKRMILPELGAGLAWIGFVRPGLGAIPPCAELQARYFAALVDGICTLPTVARMQADIDEQERLDLEQFPDDAARLVALTDYLRFMEGVAEVLGCKPPLRELFWRSPKLWAKVVLGPLCAAQYRLRGPGARPEEASAFIEQLPTMPWPVLGYEMAFLLGCKLLYTAGMGERFRPIGF